MDKKYQEKYVVFESFNSKNIVAYDEDPVEAMKKARKKGFKNPVIMYVPDENISELYEFSFGKVANI